MTDQFVSIHSKSGPVMTSKAASAYCAMAVQTLYNLISQGEGPKHYKQGNRNAFYASDLDEWNRSRLRPAGEEGGES